MHTSILGARFAQWWHCMLYSHSPLDACATSIGVSVIGCSCRRVFWKHSTVGDRTLMLLFGNKGPRNV
jgi:hypothetical protein